MKTRSITAFFLTTLATLILFHASEPSRLYGQTLWTNPGPPSPQAQRQMLEQLRQQLNWLDDATKNAPRLASGADVALWRQFDALRVAFDVFKKVLTPWQLEHGANDLAELDAGLAIISEAFGNFQEDLDRGRNGTLALRTLCQVLRDSTKVWGQELGRVAKRLQVGR
jgi:hypothetical protein